MLHDTNDYLQLPSNPTNKFLDMLKSLLDMGKNNGIFCVAEVEKLYVNNPVVPILHSLPKVHKGVFPPPLRPIVAVIGSMGERLSAWVDAFLQLLVDLTPSFIQDTKHIVNILDGQKWEDSYWWLSCDVIILYPSIPHNRALVVM